MKNLIYEKFKFLFPFLCVFLIAFAVYAPSLQYDLTLLDDYGFIHASAHNYKEKTILIDAFKTDVFFKNGPTPFYRPVLSLSFALDNKIAGESVFFAHLTNILLHCISSIIVLLFFRYYLRFNAAFSFFAAALFAVHPATIQTVAWIPGRNDSIYFILFFISFIFFIEYLNTKKFLLFFSSFFFLLLCFFTKESAISIPFVFLAYYLLFNFRKDNKKIIILPVVFWITGAVLFLAIKKAVIPTIPFSLSLFRIGTRELGLFLKHILSVFSFHVSSVSYLYPKGFIAGFFSIFLLLFFTFFKKKSFAEMKQSVFYLFFILVFFAPDFVGDTLTFHGNRIYIPLFAILVIFMSFCNTLAKNYSARKLIYTFLSILIVFSSYITLTSCSAHKDGLAFWQALNEQEPKERLVDIKFISIAYMEKGYLEEGLKNALYTAEETKFNNDEVVTILAYSYLLIEDYANARKYYEIVLENDKYHTLELFSESYIMYTEIGMQEKALMVAQDANKAVTYSKQNFDRSVSRISREITTSRKRYAELLSKTKNLE